MRVNRGFYKNYPQACGEAAVADWIGRIHLSSWELSTNVPRRASSFPFNNNDSFVANCHDPSFDPPPPPLWDIIVKK